MLMKLTTYLLPMSRGMRQLGWLGKGCSYLPRPALVSAVTMSRGMRQFCMSVSRERISWYGSEKTARSCRDLPRCLQLLCLAECVSSACLEKGCSFPPRVALVSAVTGSCGMLVGMARKGLLVLAETCPGVCSYGVSRNTSVGMARKVLLVPAETYPGDCLQLRCLAECVSWYGSERAARSCRDLPLHLQLLCLAECVCSMARKGLLVPAETCPCVCVYGVSRNVSVCMARKGLLVPAEACPGICMYGVTRIVSVGKAVRSCRDLSWCLKWRCLSECVSWYGSERAARSCRDLSWCLQLRCLAECVSWYDSARAALSCRDLPISFFSFKRLRVIL